MNDLVVKTKNSLSKVNFKLKKMSPEILVGLGIVGVIAGTVMACKATTKVNDILDETKENVDKVHECLEMNDSEKYTKGDSQKDLTIIYTQTAVKMIKLYGPAILITGASIASIIASNNIMRKRNLAIAAAYATVDQGFKDYRNRVVEKFGDEVEKELRYNIKEKVFIEKEIDEKTGKDKKVKNKIRVVDENGFKYSEFSKFFDASSRYWQKDSEYNLMFLRDCQNHANDRLRDTGHLFLNEVYDMLDIPRTKAGQVCGWLYRPDDQDYRGDSFVDFGIYRTNKEANGSFVNGYEPVIILDFNVDGNILDLI